MRIFLAGLALQIQRLLEIVSRIRILLQIELGKTRQLPCFRIAGIAVSDLLRFLSGLGVVLLLKELIGVRRVWRHWRIADRLRRLYVEQGRVLVGRRR